MGFWDFESPAKTARKKDFKSSSNALNEGVSEWRKLQNLSYDKELKHLSFDIILCTKKPCITRYRQTNYEKIPIYKLRTKYKKLQSFNEKIDPEKFVSKQIFKSRYLNKKFMLELILKIGVVPLWREKEIEIENLKKNINICVEKLRDFESEKEVFTSQLILKPDEAGNFWLRFVFLIFTFGLSFIGYVSKRTVKINTIWNDKNKEMEKIKKEEIKKRNFELNKEIIAHNKKIKAHINELKIKMKNSDDELIKIFKKNVSNIKKKMITIPDLKPNNEVDRHYDRMSKEKTGIASNEWLKLTKQITKNLDKSAVNFEAEC